METTSFSFDTLCSQPPPEEEVQEQLRRLGSLAEMPKVSGSDEKKNGAVGGLEWGDWLQHLTSDDQWELLCIGKGGGGYLKIDLTPVGKKDIDLAIGNKSDTTKTKGDPKNDPKANAPQPKTKFSKRALGQFTNSMNTSLDLTAQEVIPSDEAFHPMPLNVSVTSRVERNKCCEQLLHICVHLSG